LSSSRPRLLERRVVQWGLGYLGAVRLGDGLSEGVGPLWAAFSGPLFALVVAIAAWALWRSR